MANAPTIPNVRKRSEALPFAFLVYREEGADYWTARSVLTGHIAHGPNDDAAISALLTVIDVSILVASQHGQSPPNWLKRQRPDANEYALDFCRLVLEGVAEEKRSAVSRSGRVLEMRIAKRVA